jgi:hypothetical protein
MYALLTSALLSASQPVTPPVNVEVASVQASEGKSKTELAEQVIAPVQTQSVASVQADGSLKIDCTHTDHHPEEHLESVVKTQEPK